MTTEQLKASCREVLTENILPFWLDNMRDRERGGWYGQMTGRGQIVKDAPRGGVLYARLLWTFSAAYRVNPLPNPPQGEGVLPPWGELEGGSLLDAATMTKEYIEQHFIDREYGGTYWSVDANGKPLDTKKQFYAIGFMIYGFSEYARATGDEQALCQAIELFEVIEKHALDRRYGGYIEACSRNWDAISDMRLSDKDENYPKSQNTHLHIIEPYTNLLRAMRELKVKSEGVKSEKYDIAIAAVEEALRRLISLFTDRILNPQTHHLDLFFDMDWRRMSDTASYGHDIECSWLLHEAALVLGDKDILQKVEPIVRQVAKASEEGMEGIYLREQGPGAKGSDAVWWVQAEAVVGFINLYQHFGDEAALQKALAVWQYIREHLIDYENGEWYWSIRADGSVNLDDDHAGFWKCPYHNSRMCLEVMERIAD